MLSYLPLAALVAAAFAAPSPVERSGPVLEAPFPNAPISAPPAATSAPAGPDPSKVTINSIAYGGTGCPQGSVGSFISSDRLTSVNSLVFNSYNCTTSDQCNLGLIMPNFIASIGPGVPITSSRTNCQLNINLQYPSGFQYSILGTDFRGYANLGSGVSGVQSATYYFSGSSTQATTTTNFKGPTTGDYLISDKIPFTSTIWSPCGAALPLNVNSQIRLTSTNAQSSGLLTQDSIDGKVTFVVGVQWQAC